MDLKEYQHRSLETFVRWQRALDQALLAYERQGQVLSAAQLAVPEELKNVPHKAWQQLVTTGDVPATATSYVSRADANGRPIPHACFKIPTGGGKTLLGTAVLERLGIQRGLVLWIVPTKAIYEQTKAAFWNREHPYRQILERGAAGRVMMLEKDQAFTRNDVNNYLCMMLLMLPATNRQKGKEFLRMFRDSARYLSFFPDTDDDSSLSTILEHYPDMDCAVSGVVKYSLFNVLKMLRPVVILDEAHKAYGSRGATEFVQAVNRLDPQMVVEFSATPNRNISNLLVDVSGVELKKEEMIKLPVQVTSFHNVEWQDTLAGAFDKLQELASHARSLQADQGRYIRPMAVVRVERTGSNQRDGAHIHVEDVRDYLIRQLGESPTAVRIKSSEYDEIAGEDLLSEVSPVRWIITKAALMEGWDCSFAYILVMLDSTHSERALTQLVGRVLRQPHARRTGRKILDQSYVYCHQTSVNDAIQRVKRGLEKEGLTGLDNEVFSGQSGDIVVQTLQRRDRFRRQNFFLPKVLHRHADGWVDLDYQCHILPMIDWHRLSSPNHSNLEGTYVGPIAETVSVDVGNSNSSYQWENLLVDTSISLSWFARQITDLIPNPWQASRIVSELIQVLHDLDLGDSEIYAQRRVLIIGLRTSLADQVTEQAERIFCDKLKCGDIRFDLEAGEPNFRVVDKFDLQVAPSDHTLQQYGCQMQRSLFEPVYEQQFDSDLERRFAFYWDRQEMIQWWHRIAVRQQHEYYLRGWKPNRIWPDFIAMSTDAQKTAILLVVEAKGGHLDNVDTEYKRRVFAALEGWLNRDDVCHCGMVEVGDGPAKGKFTIVFTDDEFPSTL